MNRTDCPMLEKSISFIVLAVFSSLSGLVAIFGNTLVLLAIYTTRNLRTTSNLFIASLAASDFFVGSIMDPILAVRAIKYSYFGKTLIDPDDPFKVTIDFLWIQAVVVTTFGLMAVSVDRYIAITKVFIYEGYFTPRRCAYLISFIWLFSFLFASTRLFIPNKNISILWVTTAVTSCGVPFTVTSYSYLMIFKAARKQLKRIVNETTVKTRETRRVEEARHRKTAWTIGIVITLFFFLWFPSLVVATVNLCLPEGCIKTKFAHQVWIWVEWIAYLSSAINPWVYSMRSSEFQSACKLRLGIQKTRIIPEEMISRSKARPSVIAIDGANLEATKSFSNTVLKQTDQKKSNYLLPPVV